MATHPAHKAVKGRNLYYIKIRSKNFVLNRRRKRSFDEVDSSEDNIIPKMMWTSISFERV